jgi:hypothetical protein
MVKIHTAVRAGLILDATCGFALGGKIQIQNTFFIHFVHLSYYQ